MDNYLKSAISKIYGKGEDFIILGLTGRTGSGCSTVARILQNNDLNHTLFSGDTPSNNEERQEKIISKHFKKSWESFSLIQVRSVLTLIFSECGSDEALSYIKSLSINIEKETEFKEKLDKIKLDSKGKDIKQFYTVELPKSCEDIKNILGESAFVKLYQKIGTNLRMSGKPTEEQLVEGQFFALAEKINVILKDIKKANKEEGKNTFIVIDAIRSPLEAMFFQERYSAFYLMAVSCSDENRKERLRKLKYTEDDIVRLDEQEYKRRDLKVTSSFSVQDIQACLQKADLYISNPNEENAVSEFKTLTKQVIKFTSLMKRPGLISPTALERCMQIAYTAKLNSGCISRQVGAVITDSNFSIQAVGWNDTPYGQVPCNLRNRHDLISGKDQAAYSCFEKNDEEFLSFAAKNAPKYPSLEEGGRNSSYCFKTEYNTLKDKDNQVHTRSLHAEENAFLQISKYGGRGIEGGYLFTTASPCELCAKKAYQLGIKKIYYIDPYPGIATNHILMAGVNNPELILFSGAIGRAFHLLYTPVVAYKDEMNALTDNI
jgi:dCMP deaminase